MPIYLRNNNTGSVFYLANWQNNIQETPDTTAPVLSSPTAAVNGAYAATGTVSTDESGGTLYFIATTNSTETAATIKESISNQPVVSAGTQNISVSGLTPETTYYIHYTQVDGATNTSNVVSSTSFTTEAATSGGFSSWEEWMESLDAGTFTTKLRTFLQGKGYSGSTTSMLYNYLKTVSSKASHQERKKDWEDGGWN